MKVKDLKKKLKYFDDELEVYIQERTVQSTPSQSLYSMCNMRDFNIGIQRNGRAVYLAIGDVVTQHNKGFCRADGTEIKYVSPFDINN